MPVATVDSPNMPGSQRPPLDPWAAIELALTPLCAALLAAHADPVALATQALMKGAPLPEAPPGQSLDNARRATLIAFDALLVRFARHPDSSNVARLATRLALTPVEFGIVVTLALAETSTRWTRVLAHVGLDYGHPSRRVQTLFALFGSEVLAVTDPSSPLRRLGVLVEARMEPSLRTDPGPLGERLHLHHSLLAILFAVETTQSSRNLTPGNAAENRVPMHAVRPSMLPTDVVAALRESLSHRGLVLLVGPVGHDRPALLAAASGRAPVVIAIDVRHVPNRPHLNRDRLTDMCSRIDQAIIDAIALDRPLCLELSPGAAASRELAAHVSLRLVRFGAPIFVASVHVPGAWWSAGPARLVRIPAITHAERLQLVARILPRQLILKDIEALEDSTRSLALPSDGLAAAVFAASGDAFLKVAGDAKRRPVFDASVFARAARQQLTSRIGSYADALESSARLVDIKLPDAEAEQLRELVAAYRHRDKVFQQWGFGARDRRGRGITSLFHGPPGTGKTMAAGAVARELGLEVFRVDLSRIVDKYVGETEKALGRLFDEAERGDVLLLFDEADSLFAKRTEVRSSTDRYANMEINYLLQRMESYSGVIVLTTNHEAQIDPAFKRRIRYHVAFPMPTPVERERIWASLLPETAPVAADIDFETLGYRYDMSGGHIKTAVLTAATLAAASGQPIAMRHLVAGGDREYRSLGKVVRAY